MKTIALLLCAIIGIQTAHACTVVSPIYTFVYQNDKNGDSKLDKDEWKNAHLDDNLIANVKLKKLRHLLKLDTNKNGVFDSKDEQWDTAFAYKTDPCVYWQQKVTEYDSQSMLDND